MASLTADGVLAALAATTLVAAAVLLPPRPFGDAPEYLLMAESWTAHGSPALRAGDVDALRRRVAASSMALRVDDALGNDFEGRDGRFYCYHFWFYPLATLPARCALRGVGADELRAGPLTNAVLFGAAIAGVLLVAPAPPWPRRGAAALLATSPALGFLLWPHPEVLSFAMATLALVAAMRGAHAMAILCAALASVQNPPLALLALLLAVRGWRSRPAKARGRRLLAWTAAALPVLASPSFFLWKFSTPNLAAYETAGLHSLSAAKAAGLLFDLDLGLVRYAPLTVLLFLAVTLIALRAREGGDAGLVAVLALMMVVSSATGNWNHGTTGPSRYVVWLFPLIASVLLLGPTASALLAAPRRAYPALVALAVAAQAAVAAARGGVAAPLDYLEHSAMARFVLDRWPGQYAPLPEVFRERTAHTEADLDEPVVYRRDGRCRKALARWRDAEALRARCGTLPEPARAFFASHPPKEDRTRWIYVDY